MKQVKLVTCRIITVLVGKHMLSTKINLEPVHTAYLTGADDTLMTRVDGTQTQPVNLWTRSQKRVQSRCSRA